jgi:hypothetical protein
MFNSKTFLYILLGIVAFAPTQNAFSLLGPNAPWQTTAIGYTAPVPGSLGGAPMNLDEEYRWNVPSVHYGFTADFLNFFGVRGTEEIEKAIAILNNLPPADTLNIDDYPLESLRMNHRAQAVGILDLKSTALQFLTVSMGIADPTRYAYTIRNRFVVANTTNYVVTMRNFDPVTWDYSPFVNGTLYTYQIVDPFAPGIALAVTTPADPLDQLLPRTLPVSADSSIGFSGFPAGSFYTGLTRDDVAGLKYIYRSSNYNTETALGDISGAGGGLAGGGGGGTGIGDFPGTVTSPGGGVYDFPFLITTNTTAVGGGAAGGGQVTTTNAFINPAIRAGRQKISFLRSDYDSLIGAFFQPLNVRFSENVLTNGNFRSQTLIRTVTQPDYIFDAADLQQNDAFAGGPVSFSVSTAANWLSSDTFDGTTGDDDGPGIITPSASITFNNVGPMFLNLQAAGTFFLNEGDINTSPIVVWGSFDGTTNAPTIYPNRVTIEDLERLVGAQ